MDAAAVNKFAVANLFSMGYASMHGQVMWLLPDTQYKVPGNIVVEQKVQQRL